MRPVVVIDGIFFQIAATGIARLWRSLLEEWAATPFGQRIVLLDRGQTAPRVPGISVQAIPRHDWNRSGENSYLLQRLCDEEGADLFVSTYYTTPLRTPSVFMAYDMIPEVFGFNRDEPQWREKRLAIQHACAYLAISESTARDLTRYYPHVRPDAVTVAHCGLADHFRPASAEEIASFRRKHGISRPYFLTMGARTDYKNVATFFRALGRMRGRERFTIVCTGGQARLEPELARLLPDEKIAVLQLGDAELRAALSGAVALVYPSLYEGFGLPVAEAMACGCPVVTTATSSIPEVGGDAVLYLCNPTDAGELADALEKVQEPAVRQPLIAAGLEWCRRFTWARMASIVADCLMRTHAALPTGLGRHADPLWPELRRFQALGQRAAESPAPSAHPLLRVLRASHYLGMRPVLRRIKWAFVGQPAAQKRAG